MKIFIAWFIFFACIICFKIPKIVKKSKIKKRKNQLYINNEFVKGNIERIVKENNEFRKSFATKIFFLAAGCILLLALSFLMISIKLFIYFGMLGAFALLFLIFKCESEYRVGFKKNVIIKVIKEYNPNLEYSPKTDSVEMNMINVNLVNHTMFFLLRI